MSHTTVEILTTPAALQSLEPEWEALWRRTPRATPFQSPAWLLPWWHAFGTARPIVACLRDDDRLTGLLPLYLLEADASSGTTGETKLLSIGIGVSDYLDILLEPDAHPDAPVRLLHAALEAGHAAGAAVCDLTDIPAGSPLASLTPPPNWHATCSPGPPCPVLMIPPRAASAEAILPPHPRRKLRMNRHRADRLGQWQVEPAEPATVTTMTETLLRLVSNRWNTLDATARQFHLSATPKLLTAGLLRLAILRVGDAEAAACYALADNAGRLHFYQIGFNPAFTAISPGSLLIAALIDTAIAENRREVHFLRGDEAYKYAWGAVDRLNTHCRFRRE